MARTEMLPAATSGWLAGIPHRNWAAGDRRRPAAAVAPPPEVTAVDRRGPLVWTRIVEPSNATTTVPSSSVRYVAPAASWSRSIVDGAGCPYGLPLPADTTATRGRTAARKAGVL